MGRSLKLHNYKIAKLQNNESGYILITLMLAVTLAVIALLAVLPRMKQQIQRDQEEELRHRGSAYMRAIQHYYKKFGRYPSRIEDLENSNNVRFLRKRYKDPMSVDPKTGKERDFKFLHPQDITVGNGPLLGQAAGPGGVPGQGGIPGQGGLGGLTGLQNAFGQSGQLGGMQRTVSQTPPQTGGADDSDQTTPTPSQAGPNSPSPTSSSSSPSDSGTNTPNGSSSPGAGFNGPVFGGGPIVGVASTSKATTIREFDKKNHYKDWLFIYDPTSDRGGLLVGPWQTAMSGGLGTSGPGQSIQNMNQPGAGQSTNPQPFPGQSPVQNQNPRNAPNNPGDFPPDQ